MPAEPRPNPNEVLATVGWEATETTEITAGWDAHLWRFETADGKAHALRLYRLGMGDEAERAAMGRRETTAIEALRDGGLPAPEVEATGTFGGSTFLIQRWLPGIPMLDDAEVHPWDIWRMGRIFGRLHARMHSITPAELPTMAEWVVEMIREPAPNLVPALESEAVNDAFIHMDYHPLNVLVRNRKISGLVDFSAAALGDRRLDLGRTYAVLTTAPLPPGWKSIILGQARKAFRAAWQRGYTDEAGEWPLTPLFVAVGAAHYLTDVEQAVREGRGWATTKDADRTRRLMDESCALAGISPK